MVSTPSNLLYFGRVIRSIGASPCRSFGTENIKDWEYQIGDTTSVSLLSKWIIWCGVLLAVLDDDILVVASVMWNAQETLPYGLMMISLCNRWWWPRSFWALKISIICRMVSFRWWWHCRRTGAVQIQLFDSCRRSLVLLEVYHLMEGYSIHSSLALSKLWNWEKQIGDTEVRATQVYSFGSYHLRE